MVIKKPFTMKLEVTIKLKSIVELMSFLFLFTQDNSGFAAMNFIYPVNQSILIKPALFSVNSVVFNPGKKAGTDVNSRKFTLKLN